MSQTLMLAPPQAPAAAKQMPPTLHRFTAEQYHQLAEIGVLDSEARTELIDGLILTMAPFSPPHIAVVKRLTKSLVMLAGDAAWVSVQSSVRLDDGAEPEPDLALLYRDAPEDRVPEAANVLLVVEVAVTTEALDRNVKLVRYAEAGIPEAWLVLPEARTVETFWRPGPGGYAETALYTEADTVAVLGATLSVADAFPPVV